MGCKCAANVPSLPRTYEISLPISGHLVFALNFHVFFHSQDQVLTHTHSCQEFHLSNALSSPSSPSFTCFLKHHDFSGACFYFFLFQCFFLAGAYSTWKVPGQGSNWCHSCNSSHCSDNIRSLTCGATQELSSGAFLMKAFFFSPCLFSSVKLLDLKSTIVYKWGTYIIHSFMGIGCVCMHGLDGLCVIILYYLSQ